MESIIKELLPYVKSFVELYIIWSVIINVLGFGVIIYIFRTIFKRRREFDKQFKNRWK